MTDHPERSPSPPPDREFNDGWWHTIIDALLEEIDGSREQTRERGRGRGREHALHRR